LLHLVGDLFELNENFFRNDTVNTSKRSPYCLVLKNWVTARIFSVQDR